MPVPGLILKALGTIGTGAAEDALKEGVKSFLSTAAQSGLATACTATLAACSVPVAIPVMCYAVLFAGSLWWESRADAKKEEELKAHFAEVLEALNAARGDLSEAAEQVSAIAERREFVWARLSGADQAAMAERFSLEFKMDVGRLLEDAGLSRDTDNGRTAFDDLFTLNFDTNARVVRIEAKIDNLTDMVAQVLRNQQAPPQQARDEAPQATDFERDVVAAAYVVSKVTKDRIDALRAAIILAADRRDFTEADRLLAELKQDPAISHTFDIFTLEGDRWRAAGEFDRAIQPYETAWALRRNDPAARNNLAIALQSSRAADTREHLRRAVELHSSTLALVPPRTQTWAMTQHNLATALQTQASASEGAESARLLGEAVAAYRLALEVYVRQALPQDWAMTQNNLGNALRNQAGASEGAERARLLGEAVAAHRLALEVRTRQALPQDWAMTQHNLANALVNQASASVGAERARLLVEAVAAYRLALEVRTRQALPQDWAMTQNNLAAALSDQARASEGAERARLMGEAVAAYRLALEVFTRQALPQDWARTQNNLANALRDQASASDGAERARLLGEAVAAYRLALELYTRQALPQDWAMTQSNLANALRDQAVASEGAERARLLGEAVAACRLALQVYTRQALPQGWAMTQNNLAAALADLAQERPAQHCALLREAIACGKAALTVYTAAHFPRQHAGTSRNLAIDRSAYEAAGCDKDVPFDVIKPAE